MSDSPLILFGAFDRHNFGDLLLADISAGDEVPAEDRWEIHLWAKLDSAAEGPLYFQFSQNLNGTSSDVWRYDEENFPGGKYFSADIELLGGKGFNKDRTYDVKAVQVSAKGKDITLANGKIKLIKSGKKPAKSEDDEEDKAPEDQVVHDSLAGDDKGSGDEPPPAETPPPVEPKAKKGCTVDSDSSACNGALLLLVLGAGVAARPRRAACARPRRGRPPPDTGPGGHRDRRAAPATSGLIAPAHARHGSGRRCARPPTPAP